MKKRGMSLSLKLNILIVISILAVSISLMATSYHFHCKKVDEYYSAHIDLASKKAVENIVGEMVMYYWDCINTDEFRQLQQRAREADDESIITEWMMTQPSFFYLMYQEDGTLDESDEELYWTSLLNDYDSMMSDMTDTIDLFNIKNCSIQLDVDGTTYNLVDPGMSLLETGSIEEPIEAFEAYGDNEQIPPAVYHSQYGWLLTVCTPIRMWQTGKEDEVAGLICVDIDMNEVMRDRYAFLINCILFVLIQLTIAIAVSVFLMRRMVTQPLKSLAQGAMAFVKDDDGYTREDIIDLPIHSNDEIDNLYQNIQTMQTRIVDYTSHLASVTAERERVNTELSIATNIQENMLPHIFPPFPDRREFDLYASMDPAKEVGGDFYDFVLVDDDHLAFLVADVSDKGVPAALFMMSAKIIINYCARNGGTPGEILTAANAQLCRNNTTRMFVTVWLGMLELSTGRLTCTNAGHEYPILRGQDGAFQVYKDKHGLVMGAMQRMVYRDYELQLQPGDAIFVYTDGVPEANNAAGELFGMDRTLAALNKYAHENPEGILRGVRREVDAFVAGAKQFDDLTMLCLVYKGPTPQE